MLARRAARKAQVPYANLFSPLDLGPDIGVLPNRALMGSMHSGLEGTSMPGWMDRWLGGSGDHSLERMASYFRERAEGHVGLMVTGGIAPNWQGWTGPFSSQLTTHDEMLRHKVVTEAVHGVKVPYLDGDGVEQSVASRICLQILHTGRYAYHPFPVSASATQSPISPFKARELSKSGIQRTIRDFVQTAVLAKEAGYDGVEIMGSEGYLLSQFLSPRTNHRTDDYGGSLANRARFPLEIVRQTREAVGKDFIIVFRLSLLDLVEDGLLFEESVQLAGELEAAGCTILNTGIGWHEARVPTIATSVPRGAFVFPTAALKAAGVTNLPLVATNRINDPRTANDILDQVDMVSMARPFLADPHLLRKSYEDRPEEINTCIGCNQACLDHVFLGKTASCLVNPRACHEDEIRLEPLPAEQRLKIGVVGAGPAGCSFAIAAAQMGHEVTLYDQDSSIGGQFNMAKRIPGKEEFHETLRYFETMLEKEGVKLELGRRISIDEMSASDREKWVIATGVDPRDPKIPGQDHPKVLSYIDVLKHRKPVGERVAVIGAGGIGFDVSEYLLYWMNEDKHAEDVREDHFWNEWGVDSSLKTRGGLSKPRHVGQPQRKVYLMQRKSTKLGATLGKTTGWIHRATLTNSGAVEMIKGASYKMIDSDGNLHIEVDGVERVLEVDTIVLCAGQVEKNELEIEAAKNRQMQDRVITIGGARTAGELDAKRAVNMGVRLAQQIHRNDLDVERAIAVPPSVEEKLYDLLRKYIK